MKNILSKEELCSNFAEVEMRAGSRVVPAVVTLLGIILLVCVNTLGDAESLSAALLMVAIVLLAFGIVRLIRPAREMVYVTTGEKVVRKFTAYEQENRQSVEDVLKEGDFDKLTPLAAKNSSAPLVTVTYATPSGSLRIGQMLHYVPYEYQPLTEPYVHKTN